MCTRRYFYRTTEERKQQQKSVTAMLSSEEDEDEPLSEEDEDDDDDKDEFMQDFPYTSSSLDRSSVGSIPWAEDAIKHNEIEWDQVESMLNGSMPLPAEDAELRNEILDWQRKFPQLLKFKPTNIGEQQSLVNAFDGQLLSSLSLDSLEDLPEHELFDEDELATPTEKQQQQSQRAFMRKTHATTAVQTLDGALVSKPVNLWQRQNKMSLHEMYAKGTQTVLPYSGDRHKTTTSTTTTTKKPLITYVPASNSANRLRMPFINEYGTLTAATKRHLGAITATHATQTQASQRFVQLDKAQYSATHTKSAAASASKNTHSLEKHRMLQQPLAWQQQKPISGRFNNRNAIILPAINLQRIYESNAGANCHSISNSSSMSSSGRSHAQLRQQKQLYIPQPQQYNVKPQHMSLAHTPSTAGRSISAAVHNPRINGYYVPYSASKYMSFK